MYKTPVIVFFPKKLNKGLIEGNILSRHSVNKRILFNLKGLTNVVYSEVVTWQYISKHFLFYLDFNKQIFKRQPTLEYTTTTNNR